MEDDFYATIKLKTGEEIFAKITYIEEDERTLLLLENPITIEKIKNRGGIEGYKVEPWLRTSTEDLFVINLDDVLTMSENKDKQSIVMHETFANQNHDNNAIKLNRKMGYISTINEAKRSLEKLYRIK